MGQPFEKNPGSVTHYHKFLILTQHSNGKKIINFKISQELIKHLQDEEEDYDINIWIIVRMSQRTRDKTEEHFLQNISRYSISLTKSSKLNKKNKPNKKKKRKKTSRTTCFTT